MSLTNIVLVGAPGTNKQEIGRALQEQLPHYWFEDVADKYLRGSLTDYRVEIHNALDRAQAMVSCVPSIYINSVLNNLAHVCVYSADAKGVDERTAMRLVITSSLIYALVQDSFKADLIFYIPYQGEATEDGFVEELDQLYPQIFEEFSLPYVQLSGTLEENIEQAIKEVESRLANDTTVDTPNASSEVGTG